MVVCIGNGSSIPPPHDGAPELGGGQAAVASAGRILYFIGMTKRNRSSPCWDFASWSWRPPPAAKQLNPGSPRPASPRPPAGPPEGRRVVVKVTQVSGKPWSKPSSGRAPMERREEGARTPPGARPVGENRGSGGCPRQGQGRKPPECWIGSPRIALYRRAHGRMPDFDGYVALSTCSRPITSPSDSLDSGASWRWKRNRAPSRSLRRPRRAYSLRMTSETVPSLQDYTFSDVTCFSFLTLR